MKTIELEQVRVAFRYEWNAWPLTSNEDYSEILAQRRESVYENGDFRFVVRERIYPVHLAFVRSGEKTLPVIPGDINNLKPPSERVLRQYVDDLTKLSKDGCTTVVWEHGMNCYPAVAAHLKDLFRLSILTFGDDCPGSSEIKTFPVASHFDALIYNMFVRDGGTGVRTYIEYQARGIPYCVFRPNQISAGLETYITEKNFSVADKITRMRRGEIPFSFVFVGLGGGPDRMAVVSALARSRSSLASAGITLRLQGVGMPDGALEPRSPPHPLGLGYPLGAVYEPATFGFNSPMSSLFNCRFVDLFRMGVLQFMHDKYGELRDCGFLPEVHYASYNGTPGDLIARLQHAKANPAESADIVERAFARFSDFMEETSEARVYGELYAAHVAQILGGARVKVWRNR